MDNTEFVAAAVAVQAAWTQAFVARDLAALSSLYTPAVQFWGSTAELYLSREGVMEYFIKLPLSYKRSVFSPPNVLAIGPDAFCASGNVVFVREDNEGPVDLPFRMTQVFTRQSGEWKIALHHASPVPP
jgi:ketosteroid isomerase-like protein